MKKILALILAAMMLLSLVACGNTTETETETEIQTETETETETEAVVELPYKSATELLNLVFTTYNAGATEETMLYVAGGNINNFETTSMEGPAKFVPLANEDYDQNLGYPVAEVSKIVEAASMFNMMNANMFNCYTVQFAEGTDVNAVAEAIKTNVLARRWMCGAPEKLAIVKFPGDYLLVVWGVVQFGGIVDPFVASLSGIVEGVETLVEANIAE